jgi:hypothetical protein
MANDSGIEDVWVRSSSPQEVLIEYASGVAMLVRPADFPGTPEDWYQKQNAQGSNGSLLKGAGGVTEFAVPRGSDGSLPSVTFVSNKVEVNLIGEGDGVALTDLEAAADSILPRLSSSSAS